MAAITLTPQDGGASVVVNTNIIYRVFTYPDHGTGSRVMYGIGGAIPYIMDVTQGVSDIINSSQSLVQVDTSDGTEYIYAGNSANGDGKGIMMVNENGTGSIIFFKYTEESAPIYIYSTDSPSTIAARMNALSTYPPQTLAVSETLTASGSHAMSATTMISYVNTTTGAQALSLADAGYVGQTKYMTMTADGGNAVITPTSLSSYTTITLNDVGDTVSLIWDGNNWVVVSNIGATLA
jgi:hypothetical protein